MNVSTFQSTTANLALPLILVLDIGSSSTRALLCDAAGALVPGSMIREKSAFYAAPDGTAEDDPAALLQRVVRCIDGLMTLAAAHVPHIAAVGCATYSSSILGLGADGRPITPIYTYADTRSDAAVDRLRLRLDEAPILQRTGCPLRTSYLPAVFTWLFETQPVLLQSVHRWVSVGEWIWESLFGRSMITYSAAAWTGLLNRQTLTWDQELINELPVEAEQLGQLADVSTPTTGLLPEWAQRWPALAAIPWFSAVGDGAAANIGSGCIDSRHIALSAGTSGALRVVMPHDPQIPPGLWCYRVDQDHPLLGGATSEGGNVMTWVLGTLALSDITLNDVLNDPSGDQHGLTVLPFIAGERSPGWSGDTRMMISGISVATTPFDVARAALEGVTYRWAQIAMLLRQAIVGTPTIVASGGAISRVPAWAQLVADALGLPVMLSDEPETTSRGVALLALRSIGVIKSLDERPVVIQPTHLPDLARFQIHQEKIAQQIDLYGRVVDVR